MIDRKVLKAEIDKVPQKHFRILYKIIKAFESSEVPESKTQQLLKVRNSESRISWKEFINSHYGILADSSIFRPDQGILENREIMK